MTNGNWHQIWVEQCAAAETIKLRFGLKAAFDYAVAEKLLNFAEPPPDIRNSPANCPGSFRG